LSDKQYNVAIGANQQLQWAVYEIEIIQPQNKIIYCLKQQS